MIYSATLRPIESIGRRSWADQVRENPRGQVLGAGLGRLRPRPVGNKALRKPGRMRRAEDGDNAWAGTTPVLGGLGR